MILVGTIIELDVGVRIKEGKLVLSVNDGDRSLKRTKDTLYEK